MGHSKKEKPALLIIDMVKDNFVESKKMPITPFALNIISPLNRLIGVCREHQWPVVFSTDAFHQEDFIFKGRMNPHSLADTEGAEVIDQLEKKDDDLWLPKPKFSAFFQTGLENWLREKGVTLCAVGGLSTHFCVLTTVLDAICHDFKAVLLEDCAAAPYREIHEKTLDCYRRNPLYPLLKVATSLEFLEGLMTIDEGRRSNDGNCCAQSF